MKYTLALLAAVVAVQASPVAFPQGVTAHISPSKPAPPGCKPSTAGTFGIAVMNITTAAPAKKVVSTISDGQPQAPTTTVPVPVSTISDHQPQAPTVTAVSTISDHQPQAPTAVTMAPVSQITDGQIQGGSHTVTMMPVSQISDGQIQATVTYMPVTVISDGQPQAPTAPKVTAVSTISDGQPQAPTATAAAVSTISDGQPQAPTATAVSTISDHQPQAPTGTAVSTISDHQPQAPTKTAVSTISDTQPQAPTSSADPPAAAMVACRTNSSLEISLSGGIMTDSDGRTGYIAANYQFQFDKPPQAGAIYTAGWSICANGSIALGGSNVFYQCLSGNFYNLYNVHWAAQCSPITIQALELISC